MFKLVCWTSLAVCVLACAALARIPKRPSSAATLSHDGEGNHSHGDNSHPAPRPTEKPHGGNESHHHGHGGVKPPPHFNQTHIDAIIAILHNVSHTNNTEDELIDGGDDINNGTFLPARAAGHRSGGGHMQQNTMSQYLPFLLMSQNANAARQDPGAAAGGAGGGGGMDMMTMMALMSGMGGQQTHHGSSGR